MGKSRVYFTKEITAESLQKIYEALGVQLRGRVAVKISTGETGGHNFLQPSLIKPLVDQLEGTIVECNTAYEGRRYTSEEHWKAIKEHGFLDIAPCDIMDEQAEMAIPVTNGKHLTENFVGEHLTNYDSILMLSHFKGHAMGGFGGALKICPSAWLPAMAKPISTAWACPPTCGPPTTTPSWSAWPTLAKA